MALSLVLAVAGHRCGLLAENVIEIHRAAAITPVPKAPAVVEGVIDVRGDVVPVVGLRRRLGLTPTPVQPSDVLVRVRLPGRVIALRADEVVDLVEVPTDRRIPVDDVLPDATHLDGVARLDDGLLLIHDVPAFLSSEEARTLDDALDDHLGQRAAG